MNSKAHHSAGALFADCTVIPVIRIESAERAPELARTLVDAGLELLEVTLRTPQAFDAIERIAREVPDAVVGAGTVLSGRDLDRAAAVGARFAIAPGCTDRLYRASADAPLPLIPGVASASEIMLGLEHGHSHFKFFPAQAAGGPAMLRAWNGPLPQVSFVPTGGVTMENAAEYLALPNVIAVGGSWMVPEGAIAAGDWDRIGRLARACSGLQEM
ncbi:bifunctional 4-hydroxy-2-oxoglutarate aldolase/2-dehydro-3-deoxy-phosphogluconate aldolase [Wenzhouxiangella sp. AB-CW3]|uniref:bifunctional 4-hydroxy-2-oxoglutarate aldolase/2-dehydro-3-deoxy-phosphogluconate aldolase n=1 Tax=Wenzhouxiangella sp. AB-CW3 TaxID=2771012 RepID=UPI00168AC270|nr:bifunctional 4-hydroxy-2-oxoglutarate aldolase/2-dehydro-3-deoxy-phosphogluconate aldolase [Wenzhouxiangella sp. AB-CW3]QOC23025.1 bifunctional 4-hydroxy-2-oxoglutarate aldolase/2-dehydro-3-deoxy-phosphogluconate aldolase [Wenzhouxiangella sp. AB-CW3]